VCRRDRRGTAASAVIAWGQDVDAWVSNTLASRPARLVAVDAAGFAAVAAALGGEVARWCGAQEFAGENGRHVVVPGAAGEPAIVLAGCRGDDPLHALAMLPLRLPAGDYRLDAAGLALDGDLAAIGWARGAYRYARYRTPGRAPARLVLDADDIARLAPVTDAIHAVRDLVNTPAADLGPAELAARVRELAERHGAAFREWVGDELRDGGFPTVHAVGRASDRAPRVATLVHGDPAAPRLALVGKGVCFDSGGLDVKSADGMRWMKKDMGGAAHAIALAGLVLEARLPVHLTLIVPTVDNAIAGNALRPGDVVRTRAGITIEVDNTDAEGRLILGDALAFAAEGKPDLIVDFATLTGAARIALGPELPALFANRDEIAAELLAAARDTADPLWRMPLWRPYLALLESNVADLANAGPSRHAGAITAALYLERFVPQTQAWCHFDVYAWNDADKPGRPRGGEAQALRATFEFLRRRYA
jgi:leucyl aminopeptidase